MPEHADDSSDEAVRATDFVLVAELDAALASAAADMLRTEGVEAYVRAAPGAVGVFVPRQAVDDARRLLEERLPRLREQLRPPEGVESSTSDRESASDRVDDAVWAELVAAFRGPSADVSRRRLHGFDSGELQETSGTDKEERSDLEEVFADEHYEPDPPPPLPRIGWLLGCAWAAVLGTPILFLVALWVHLDVTGWLGAIGVACFVGGFLVLVSRLGDGPDEWNDGAVV